jgi:hypothetical protein
VTYRNKKYRGMLLAELAISLPLLAIIFILLTASLEGLRRFNHYQLTRQRCTAGAQAQLDSITLTGKAIGQEDLERLWPGMSISIERSEGAGQWGGLKLIRATARAKSFSTDVEVVLSRYIVEEEGQ